VLVENGGRVLQRVGDADWALTRALGPGEEADLVLAAFRGDPGDADVAATYDLALQLRVEHWVYVVCDDGVSRPRSVANLVQVLLNATKEDVDAVADWLVASPAPPFDPDKEPRFLGLERAFRRAADPDGWR
jgi:hypothetical protein